MSNDERWFYFRYQYIETGWFDYDRHTTIESMQKLSERFPEDALYSLPALVVFAPSATKLGEVKPFGLGDGLLILSSRLEAKPQSEVDFTVAHEFAHLSLGHQQPGATVVPPDAVVQSHEDLPSEQDADRLAEPWGLALPRPESVEHWNYGVRFVVRRSYWESRNLQLPAHPNPDHKPLQGDDRKPADGELREYMHVLMLWENNLRNRSVVTKYCARTEPTSSKGVP